MLWEVWFLGEMGIRFGRMRARKSLMLCKFPGHLYGCDGTFLFPQANGHVSQDQEEPVYLESTARAPTEDETQVGPLLRSAPLSLLFHWYSLDALRSLLADSEVERE